MEIPEVLIDDLDFPIGWGKRCNDAQAEGLVAGILVHNKPAPGPNGRVDQQQCFFLIPFHFIRLQATGHKLQATGYKMILTHSFLLLNINCPLLLLITHCNRFPLHRDAAVVQVRVPCPYGTPEAPGVPQGTEEFPPEIPVRCHPAVCLIG